MGIPIFDPPHEFARGVVSHASFVAALLPPPSPNFPDARPQVSGAVSGASKREALCKRELDLQHW